MHASYAEKGLRILAFPCNQFGGQVRRMNTESTQLLFVFCLLYLMLYEINIMSVAMNE